MRTQACYVSNKIEGPYTGGDVLCSDLGGWNSGTAQGGIVQTPDGKWFSIVFQDHGALGRIPVLVPIYFENEFPVFGTNGIAPEKVEVTDNRPDYKYAPLYSNDFTNPAWQWNHIPNKKLISLNSNTFTVTTDKICKNPIQAANTLTQRTFTEHCSGSIEIDASKLNDGDVAGLCALEGEYGFIGITKESGKFNLITAEHKIPYSQWTMGVFDDNEPDIITKESISTDKLLLKATFNLGFNQQNVQFAFSDINDKSNNFKDFGTPVKLRYTLDQFVGVRFALFCYSTKESGGKASFKEFKIELL